MTSVWRVLSSVRLSSYCCRCSQPKASTGDAEAIERCAQCGLRRAGATVVDLGSGIGNVVAAAALLSTSGALGSDAHVYAVRGAELLPSLHAVAESAIGEEDDGDGKGADSDDGSSDS